MFGISEKKNNIFHADIRRLKPQMGAEKNQREKKEKNTSHADIRRLKAQIGAEKISA